VHTGEKETQLCSRLPFSTQEKLGDLWYRGGLVPNARSTRGLIERYSPFLALASSCVTWFLCHQSINDVLLAEIVRRQRWQRRFFRCVCFFTANVTDSFWSMQMASPRLHQTPNTHRCERIISMFSWLRMCRSTLRAEDLFVAGCASIAAGFFFKLRECFFAIPLMGFRSPSSWTFSGPAPTLPRCAFTTSNVIYQHQIQTGLLLQNVKHVIHL